MGIQVQPCCCPSEAPPIADACDLCSADIPDTFNVQLADLTNSSCTVCTDLNGVDYVVTYQGTCTLSGNTHHYWASEADVFGVGSGTCSGVLTDKRIFVAIRNTGSCCYFFASIVDDTADITDPVLNSDSLCFSGESTICSGDPCVDGVGIIAASWKNTSDCDRNFADNILLFT